MTKQKDLSIETARGIALILMVGAHVIGSNVQEGLRVNDESFGRYLYYSLVHIRMPLFTVISGYVYSLNPVVPNSNLLKFFKGKARRLLLPLFSISSIQFLLQCYVPGVNADVHISEMWKIYFYPYSHFWFLQAISIVFILVSFLDFFQLMSNIKKWGVVMIIASCSFLFLRTGAFFSFSRAFYLLPFFVLGCGLNRFEYFFKKKNILKIIFAILFIGLTLHQLCYFEIAHIPVGRRSLLGLFIGLASTCLLIVFRFKSKLLARIGFYSYGIFLLHLFGTASSRILTQQIGVSLNTFVLFSISFCVGIIVPVFMEIIIIRFKWARRVLLGMR